VTKVAEEYCWAITQMAGRSCFGRLSSSGLELWFQLYYFHTHNQYCTATVQLVHINSFVCILSSDLRIMRLTQSLLQLSCWLNQAMLLYDFVTQSISLSLWGEEANCLCCGELHWRSHLIALPWNFLRTGPTDIDIAALTCCCCINRNSVLPEIIPCEETPTLYCLLNCGCQVWIWI
jgi:hypothetical protein